MTYLDVGKEYEDKYLKHIMDGDDPEHIFPCFQDSCTDEILNERVQKRINEAYENEDLDPYLLLTIFGQYLYDQYHVEPADIEFITQAVFYGMTDIVGLAAEHAAELVLTGELFEEPKIKKPSKNNIITPDFGKNN